MTYLCNDCGHEFEEPHVRLEKYAEVDIGFCPNPECNSIDITVLTPEYLKEQALFAKADEDYDSKAIKERYDD